MLRLPDDLRGAFKEPFGPVYTDTERLLSEAGSPVVAVGDVVTYHLRVAGHDPQVAVIDGQTEREAVSEEVARVLDGDASRVDVVNERATLSEELLRALVDAIGNEEPTVLVVEGEEDLATLPAMVAVPAGGSVVYGQPGEGMVLVSVDEETKSAARALLRRLSGDSEAALSILDDG
jgi:uncharacterized protein (UPF0218 family)